MHAEPSNTRVSLLALMQDIHDDQLMLFGRKYVDLWAATDVARIVEFWAQEMIGFTPREVLRGRQALRALEWPPTLPEFQRLCRPAPDAAAAYWDAVAGFAARRRGERGVWTHPAIYWAAVDVSQHDIETQSYAQLRHRWEHALAAQYRRATWEAVPDPALALPAPVRTTRDASPLIAAAVAATQRKAGGVQRAWAARVLERAAAGLTVPPISVRWAREVLNVGE
jgi:hypothetical protein